MDDTNILEICRSTADLSVGGESDPLSVPLDLIYEICRRSLPLYRVAIYDRRFHRYMEGRLPNLQKDHTVCLDGVYTLCGRLHRVDGPATVCYDDNYPNYHNRWINITRAVYVFPLVRPTGKIEMWYQYGKLHREGGPAVIGRVRSEYPSSDLGDSIEEWWWRGKPHRDDGPAVRLVDEWAWYRYGKIHRDGGPAVEINRGLRWYRYDKRHRDGGPATIHPDGTLEWVQYGKRHRVGGPALTYPDGDEIWYQRGELHRVGGPAVIGSVTYWYRNGCRCRSEHAATNEDDPEFMQYMEQQYHIDNAEAVKWSDKINLPD